MQWVDSVGIVGREVEGMKTIPQRLRPALILRCCAGEVVPLQNRVLTMIMYSEDSVAGCFRVVITITDR